MATSRVSGSCSLRYFDPLPSSRSSHSIHHCFFRLIIVGVTEPREIGNYFVFLFIDFKHLSTKRGHLSADGLFLSLGSLSISKQKTFIAWGVCTFADCYGWVFMFLFVILSRVTAANKWVHLKEIMKLDTFFAPCPFVN